MGRCRKRRFRTKVDAMLALARTQGAANANARHGAKAAKRTESRHYRCPTCKGWHLTSA
jgi:hypothetical protein